MTEEQKDRITAIAKALLESGLATINTVALLVVLAFLAWRTIETDRQQLQLQQQIVVAEQRRIELAEQFLRIQTSIAEVLEKQ